MDDLVTFIRWANLIVGSLGFLWLVQRIVSRRKVLPPEIVSFLCVIGFFILGSIEVSSEALIDDQPAGPRSFIFLVGNLGLCIALGLTQKHRTLKIERVP